MNFIDRALENGLHGDDFLQAMAGIYEEPETWEVLETYPQYIQDVIYIIDYDTEMQMDGPACLHFGSTAKRADKIIQALENCNAKKESKLVKKVVSLNPDSDKFDENIEKIQEKMVLYNDDEYEKFWDQVRSYIDKCQN